jgi:chemotaxis protein CheX
MKMELIQPFVNAADAVLAQMLECTPTLDKLSMEEEAYRRKGVAALVMVKGQIEGRIILDVDPETALRMACRLTGTELNGTDDLVRETVCELANQVIGNAVTTLNDQGCQFHVYPPQAHTDEHGAKSNEDTEVLVMSFETPCGTVYMNIAMHYLRRRRGEVVTAS